MAAAAQEQVMFATGNVVIWSRETMRIVSLLPTGFVTEMVSKVGCGPFEVEAIMRTADVCKDTDFTHGQVLKIKDVAGKTHPDRWFSGSFFEVQEVKAVPEAERPAA